MRRWARAGLFLGVFTAALEGRALAQQGEAQLIRPGVNVNNVEMTPYRELTLRKSEIEASSGVNLYLNSGAAFQPVTIPADLSYGILAELEAGADLKLDLNTPAPFNSVRLEMPRLYARYAVLPGNIAVEGSVFIPVQKLADRFAYRLEVPARFAVTQDLFLLGAATYMGFFGGDAFDYVHFAQLGGVGLYRFAEKFWAAFELGITLRNFAFDHMFVPIGISAGFEVFPQIIVLPGLRFPDAGRLDFRTFSVLVVYAFDIGVGHSGGESTPDIPREGAKRSTMSM